VTTCLGLVEFLRDNIMYKNIPEFDKFVEAVEAGRISQSEFDNYVIFKYRKDTVYAKDWDNVTLHSRGIIFDKRTKECIALPFKKFFNLDETDCEMSSFPNDFNYEILEKMDGSMGCVFLTRDNELLVSTPGSFQSDQSIWATKWLRNHKNYKVILNKFISGEIKVLVGEIICHLSKIVLTYDFEGMVVIAVHDESGKYFDHDKLSKFAEDIDFPVCRKFTFGSVEDIRTYLDTVEDFEGFVLHWPHLGYRVKMKGTDYCIKHRILSSIHPNRINEAIENCELEKFDEIFSSINDVLVEFPEEFVTPYTKAVEELKCTVTQFNEDVLCIANDWKDASPKELAVWMQSTNNKFIKDNFSYIMSAFRGKSRVKKLVLNLWKPIREEHFKVEEEE
jgi:T4 RnlA family RNA ligase